MLSSATLTPGVISITSQRDVGGPVYGHVLPSRAGARRLRCVNFDCVNNGLFLKQFGFPLPMILPAYLFVGGGRVLGGTYGTDADETFPAWWNRLWDYGQQVEQWEHENIATGENKANEEREEVASSQSPHPHTTLPATRGKADILASYPITGEGKRPPLMPEKETLEVSVPALETLKVKPDMPVPQNPSEIFLTPAPPSLDTG